MCSSCACADVKRERAVVNTRINIIRQLVLLYRGGMEPKTIQLPAHVLCSERKNTEKNNENNAQNNNKK